MENIKNIGWVGLGNFGLPMALRVLECGIRVVGFEINGRGAGGAKDFQKNGGEIATHHSEIENMDALAICLPRPTDVMQVIDYFGEKVPSLVIDFSTGLPQVTINICKKLQIYGNKFIDCPVSGSIEGARNGELTVFVGDREECDSRLASLLSIVGNNIFYFNNFSKGHAAKLVNQFIHLSNMAIIREGLELSNSFDLDPTLMVEALTCSSANSAMLQRFGKSIVRGDYSTKFALDLALKDLHLVQEAGNDNCNSFHELTLKIFKESVNKGHGNKNFTAICM